MRPSLEPVSSLNVVIFFLKLCGLWHFDSRLQPLYYIYGRIIYVLVSVFAASFQVLYIVKVWGNLPAMADGIYLMITIINIIFKIGTLEPKRVKDTIYFQNSKRFTCHQIDQDIYVEHFMRIAKRNSIIILSLCSTTCCTWCLDPIVSGEYKNKKLPVNAWYPIPFTETPYYQIIFFYQWSSTIVGAWLNCGLDALIAGLMALTCGQLQVLKHSLRNLQSRAMARLEQYHELDVCKMCDNNEKMTWKCADPVHLAKNNDTLEREIYEEMQDCIKHHSAIIEFTQVFHETFSASMFAQFSASMIVICITAFVLSVITPFTMQFITAVLYLNNMIIQIFFYCWYGNEVYLMSLTINDAIYNSDWYLFSPKVTKLMITMMERSKKPMILMAGKLFHLSLETFTSILRSAYSFYAVLQQMNVEIDLDV